MFDVSGANKGIAVNISYNVEWLNAFVTEMKRTSKYGNEI